MVRAAEDQGVAVNQLPLEAFKEANAAFGPDVLDVFDWERSLEAREAQGGTARKAVLEQITAATSCNLSVNTMCNGTTFRSDVVSDTTTVGICDPSYPEGSIVTVSGPYENLLGGAKTNLPLPKKCLPSTLEELHACMDLVETRCDDLGL